MTQDVSLWPSDALLQNPALLLKMPIFDVSIHLMAFYQPNEKKNTRTTAYLSNNVSVLSVDLSNGSEVTDHTEHLIDLQQLGGK